MKRVLWQSLLLVLCSAASLRAQELPPRDIWPQAAQALRDADVEAASKKTQELVSTGRQYGVRTFPLYAAGSAAVSRQSARDGKGDVANWARTTATRLDPNSAAVSFTLADEAASKSDWGGAVQAAVRGFQQLFTGYRTGLLSRSDLLIVFITALAVTAILFAVVLFLRYGRSMAHDFREMLGQRIHGGSVTVLAFALLFLPIFLWLGPVWLVFYWFAIFFPYASVRERVFIAVISLLVAALPILLDRTADTIATIESPPVLTAISSAEQSYQPEALRRMQDLIAVVPDNATLHVLIGNLQAFEGNEQQAGDHYRRAIQLNDSAGAHVNLGNLHFMQNDYAAAMTEYAAAQKKDPNLAIAYYNDSVANGETYKFQEQGQKLEQAKKIDADLIERLSDQQRSAAGPILKVAMYHPPVRDAWDVEESIARRGVARELFGNYSYFDLPGAALNPVTVGGLGALVAGVVLWLMRRRNLAGSCIKCGRTFCHRCKSARESATYCTQCIHIYLKRDGVALATKRAKLDEVSEHHAAVQRRNRLFATFVPGAAQMLEGRTIVGIIGGFLFFFFVSEALAVGRLAPALGPVAETAQLVVRVLAVVLAVVTWLVLSIPVYRRRATAA